MMRADIPEWGLMGRGLAIERLSIFGLTPYGMRRDMSEGSWKKQLGLWRQDSHDWLGAFRVQ